MKDEQIIEYAIELIQNLDERAYCAFIDGRISAENYQAWANRLRLIQKEIEISLREV